MQLFRKLHNQQGFSLVEVLVAVGLASIIITSVVSVLPFILSSATVQKDNDLADNYAKEGIEVIRQIRNTDFTTYSGYTHLHTYCIDKDAKALSECPATATAANVDAFRRQV